MKVGDKVRILDKTCGVGIKDANVEWSLGDIVFIGKEAGTNAYFLSKTKEGNPEWGTFNPTDLELIKEETMKYKKGTKVFKFINIIESNTPSKEEKEAFNAHMINRGFNLFDIIPINEEFEEYFTQHECFVTWLLNHNFIEKVKKEFRPFDLRISSLDELEILYNLIGRIHHNKAQYLMESEHIKPKVAKTLDKFDSILNDRMNKE